MNKSRFGISVFVLASAVALAEAAPHNGNAGPLSQASAAGHVRWSDAQAQGTVGEGARAEKRKAAPSGPGLQFHRYPPRLRGALMQAALPPWGRRGLGHGPRAHRGSAPRQRRQARQTGD